MCSLKLRIKDCGLSRADYFGTERKEAARRKKEIQVYKMYTVCAHRLLDDSSSKEHVKRAADKNPKIPVVSTSMQGKIGKT